MRDVRARVYVGASRASDTTSSQSTSTTTLQQQITAQGVPVAAKLFADGFEDGFAAWTSLEGGRNESITVRLCDRSIDRSMDG